MKNYIPLSGSMSGFINNQKTYKNIFKIDNPSALTEIDNFTQPQPQSLQELTNEKTETIKLSVDAALKLNIPIGSTDNKLSRIVLIQEYKKFKEITKNTETVHYGIGIRWIINIQKLCSSANISSLPMVAASGQFNYVNASARFEVNGISSQEITKLIPAPKDLTTETFFELNEAFIAIKEKIWAPETSITPKILGVYADYQNEQTSLFEESISIAHALNCIAKGKKLEKATLGITDNSLIDQIKAVYMEITNTNELNKTITEAQKSKAKKYLSIIP